MEREEGGGSRGGEGSIGGEGSRGGGEEGEEEEGKERIKSE